MGIWHEIKKAGKNTDNWLDDHFWNPVNKAGAKLFGNNNFYIGYGTNSGIKASYNPGQTSYIPKPKPNSGYSRTAAATAKDIAQGGMTKDEVIEFNMKHPNETAKRSY